jgi:ribA/ribD-fused uncharacterized protein
MANDLFGIRIIDSFSGEFRFLSNFYLSPVVMYDITFPSSEHAYQWHKTLDATERLSILFTDMAKTPTTPGQAKRRGDAVTCRPNWDSLKAGFMLQIVREKFVQNEELRHKLMRTAPLLLEEGNTWHDNFWGSCTCFDKPGCKNSGQNFLGKILMHLRNEFIEADTTETQETQP